MPSSVGPLRILVVEDESRLREVIVRAIPGMGFVATPARSAEEALRILETQKHDVMLLDLNLPAMSGMELFHAVHERWPDMQVIILTGFGDLDAAKEAIRLDVVDFLTKPAHLGDIEKAIERARKRLTEAGPLPEVIIEPEPGDQPAQGSSQPKLEDIERQHILAALARNHGNRAATAQELGIALRTLYYRLAEYQKQGYDVE